MRWQLGPAAACWLLDWLAQALGDQQLARETPLTCKEGGKDRGRIMSLSGSVVPFVERSQLVPKDPMPTMSA